MDSAQEELFDLLARIAQQDRRAFERLYQTVSGRLYGVCRHLAGQTELAEEAVQDAFVRIWHNAGDYHPERGAPLTWMTSIARYRTLDLMRARKARPQGSDEELDLVEDSGAEPSEASFLASENAAIGVCLDELSKDQRDSISLAFYRGLTHEEVAGVMNTPIGTIKSWVRRGLMALKRCLER